MTFLSRRNFIKTALWGSSAVFAPVPAVGSFRGKEAEYYQVLEDGKVVCELCPNECILSPGDRGTCRVRKNRKGRLYSLVYAQPCSLHVDAIEKKPLFHFYPGSKAFSLATAGCNMTCLFCQNWEISQKTPEQVRSVHLSPRGVADLAVKYKCVSVAHTYSEPVIFYEYMRDCAIEGKKRGIPNVMISNGYINKKPMRALCGNLGAVKIDLKSFRESFYRKICGGTLKPVLDTLSLLKEEKIWFEIVVLLIPGMNDSATELSGMCRWIRSELGEDVPLHFSRFYPTYRMRNIPPTPPAVLERARLTALSAGIRFVYIGNMLSEAMNTYCPSCNSLLIERVGFSAEIKGLRKNICSKCKTVIPGVF